MKNVIIVGLSLLLLVVSSKKIWEEEYKDYLALDHREIFEAWKKDFSKEYTSISAEANHYVTFLNNLYMITTHNSNENATFKMRLNQFGDLTGDEFRETVHGHKGACYQNSNNVIKISTNPSPKKSTLKKNINIPTSVDWTQDGVVTPVKNQGSCGSCWAFSTTGSIECNVAIKTGKLVSLSEQQLVDCSTSYGNEGCDGGLMDYAFKYVEADGGLCTEAAYPYEGVDGTCKSSTCGTKYDAISSYTDVTSDNEADLATAVASGCVSVAIEADQSSFQFYSSGVLTGNCGTSLDHGVLVVGYGSTTQSDATIDYWLVKNSWGTTWGEQGYVQICKDCNKNGLKGECGINMEPSYPVD